MGEHLPCKQGVKSSNLSISTKVIETENVQARFREDLRACSYNTHETGLKGIGEMPVSEELRRSFERHV